jgi:hypothetical protein
MKDVTRDGFNLGYRQLPLLHQGLIFLYQFPVVYLSAANRELEDPLIYAVRVPLCGPNLLDKVQFRQIGRKKRSVVFIRPLIIRNA